MEIENDKIIFKAKSISGQGSLGDNKPVKIFELETLERDIKKVTEGADIPIEQESNLRKILDKINQLKSLSGDDFHYNAMGLGNQVELFFSNFKINS